MFNKKFLLGITLSMALCLSSCYNDNEEITETTVPTEVTTAAVTTAPETTTTTEETTAEQETVNPEKGLVFFVQPIIEQYDEYDDWNLADWECRDTDVMRGCHYDGEWNYRKELIFAFSNYTDEPVTIDSIQITRGFGEAVSFTDGSDTLNIDFTVQPMHKTDYLLKAEDFDYSACESGIYNADIKIGTEYHSMNFFIDNSKLYEETFTKVFEESWGGDIGFAPDFLTEEQQKVFAKACARMFEFYWSDGYLSEEYANTHTADDFIGLFTDAFTEEYAKRLAQERYIDENGKLISFNGGGRGTDITYKGHCFLPVSADEDQVSFKAVIIHAHGDVPYKVWFDETEYHMVNTKDGWRVFQFDLWN